MAKKKNFKHVPKATTAASDLLTAQAVDRTLEKAILRKKSDDYTPTMQDTVFGKKEEKQLIIKLLGCINTPLAKSIKKSLKSDVFFDIPTLDPNGYESAPKYFADAQALAFVSKHTLLKRACRLSPEDVAVEKFYESELSCQKTNYRFKHMNFTFEQRTLLESAKKICAQILGHYEDDDFPDIDELFDENNIHPDFGPGSSIFLRGSASNIITKLSALPETTPYAYETVVKKILGYMPHYALASGMVLRDRGTVTLGPQLAQIVQHAEFFTVDKNFKAARGCVIEPSGMMLCQKGNGCLIRRRLKRAGYNLNSAPVWHDALAKHGSIFGLLATIDLASASDTIAYEFVRFMLPCEWFEALNTVRSRDVIIGSHKKRLEKFSSMGNGFTFELESLLFLSLMLAVRKHHKKEDTVASVFGDDMICHASIAQPLIDLLQVCGFETNVQKTFTSGPFRESCGNDYWRGQRVTPIYFRNRKDYAQIERVYYYANRIIALSSAYNFGYCNSSKFYSSWDSLIKRVPEPYRYGGSSDFGDTVLIGYPERRSKKGRLARLERKSRRFRRLSTPCHALACALYGVPSTGVLTRSKRYTMGTQWTRTFPRVGSEVFWL